MIDEIAIFDITPGANAEFEAAYETVRPALAAGGASAAVLMRAHESENRYLTIVTWESLDAHQAFLAAGGRAAFGPVGAFIVGTPQSGHYTTVSRH